MTRRRMLALAAVLTLSLSACDLSDDGGDGAAFYDECAPSSHSSPTPTASLTVPTYSPPAIRLMAVAPPPRPIGGGAAKPAPVAPPRGAGAVKPVGSVPGSYRVPAGTRYIDTPRGYSYPLYVQDNSWLWIYVILSDREGYFRDC